MMSEESYFSDAEPIKYCEHCEKPIFAGDMAFHSDIDNTWYCDDVNCVLDDFEIKRKEIGQ